MFFVLMFVYGKEESAIKCNLGLLRNREEFGGTDISIIHLNYHLKDS